MDAKKFEAIQKRALSILLRHLVEPEAAFARPPNHELIRLGDAMFLLHMDSDSEFTRRAMQLAGRVMNHLDARAAVSSELAEVRDALLSAFCAHPDSPVRFIREAFKKPALKRFDEQDPLEATQEDFESQKELFAVVSALHDLEVAMRESRRSELRAMGALVDSAESIGTLRLWSDPVGRSQIDGLLAGWKRGGLMTAQNNKARQEIPHVFKLWLEYKESGYCKTLYKGVTAFDRECEEQFRGRYDEEKKKWEGPTQLTVQKWRTAWERGGAKTLADAVRLTSAEERAPKRRAEPAS